MPRATDGSQAVAASLSGLSAASTYHFRIAATTGVASTAGADMLFATPAPLRASPSLSGTPAFGNLLTCNANIPQTTTPIPPPTTVAYAWVADSTPIAGSTTATHLVSAADVGHHLRCQVSISGDGAVTTAASGYDDIPARTAVAITETRVAAVEHRSTWVRVAITCSPQAAGSCALTLQLTAVRRVRDRNSIVTVGSAQGTAAPGETRTLTAWLNAKGKRLLKERRRLGVTFTVTGTVVGTLIATLQSERLVLGPPPRIRQHLRW
jgi:hypothetical protein